MKAAVVVLALVLAAGCGARPDIRYYQIEVDEAAMPPGQGEASAVFAVEAMIGDSAYEDQRIVYRSSPHRLDYYHYHRWTAPPGVMVSDFLRDAYEQTGYFRSVVAGFSPDAAVFLSGRVVAFEEVDLRRKEWLARVKMNLFLRDATTGEVLWSRTIVEEAPVTELTPEGLAAAMSTAVTKIVAGTAPEFARIAEEATERARRGRSRERAMEELAPTVEEP